MNNIEDKKEELRQMLEKAEYIVYATVVHVARSGMSRVIRFFIMLDNQPIEITHNISEVLHYKMNKRGSYGLLVRGCGMDMEFAVVYDLSYCLYCPDVYDHEGAYKLTKRSL